MATRSIAYAYTQTVTALLALCLSTVLSGAVGNVASADPVPAALAPPPIPSTWPGVNQERVLVKFKEHLRMQTKEQLLATFRARIRASSPHTGLSTLEVTDTGQSITQLLTRLRQSGLVEYAEPDYRLHLNLPPNDPHIAALWGLHNLGQDGGRADADIAADEAWDLSTGDPSIVVGVIDTGIDYAHEDLAANMWVNPGEIPGNGIDDDGNGYVDDVYGIDTANDDSDPWDDNGHGTHVAGIIGAVGNNGRGVVGVNWRISLMALKFLGADGSGWTSDAIACLTYAISNGDAPLSLRDDGVAPDAAADDGVYTATWIPAGLGAVTVILQAVHQGEVYTASVDGTVVPFPGYVYDDSVPFNWVDISQSGMPLYLQDDDYTVIPLPFPVAFYDQTYDRLAVGSNGLVYFDDDLLGLLYLNLPLPFDTSFSNAFIAAFWDDLNPYAGGQVYWEVHGTAPHRTLIMQFDRVPHYPSEGEASFQLMFYEGSSHILMQYLDVDFGNPAFDAGASATIGVQRDATFGQQYSYDRPALRKQMAILWSRTQQETPLPSVMASSYQAPNVPENTRDEDLSTRWSAHGAGAWIQFNLGSNRVLQEVAIAWHRGHRRRATFDLALSPDAEHWTIVYRGRTSGRTQRLEAYTFPPVAAHFVRITGYGNTENAWNSITEVVFPTIVASGYETPNVPANTRDGQLSTRWSAEGAGAWIQYDLHGTKTVDQVAIAWYRGEHRVATFDIAVSMDAVHWTVVYSGTSSGTTPHPETYRFPAGLARFIRITGYGNTENQWNSITEVTFQTNDRSSSCCAPPR